jgi:hypothetical protein
VGWFRPVLADLKACSKYVDTSEKVIACMPAWRYSRLLRSSESVQVLDRRDLPSSRSGQSSCTCDKFTQGKVASGWRAVSSPEQVDVIHES